MFKDFYQKYASEFQETLQSLDVGLIEKVMQDIEATRQDGRQVFLIGNGGSAASSSHWACDFGKGINVKGNKRLRVQSLTDNVAWMTALGNDLSYADIFVEQLKNYLNPGDIVIGLSVSGNSENVVRAFNYSRQNGAKVISIVGQQGGRMRDLSDVSIVVPSENYGIVEDIHMFIAHVVSQYLKSTY